MERYKTLINLNITLEDLDNEEKVLPIINNLLWIKMNSTDGNWGKCKENNDYYKGLAPSVNISRNNGHFQPKIFNLAKPITDIATKTFIGDGFDINTSGNKKEKDKVINFQQKLSNRQFDKEIYGVGKNASIYGNGLIALYNKVGDTFPRFRALNPQFADVVYDCTLAKEPILAFNIVENIKTIGYVPTENYIIYVYTKEKMYVFETKNRQPAQAKTPTQAKDLIEPLWCFTRKLDDGQTIKDYSKYHGYSGIPIVEFPNNEDLSGDFECVKQLISAYNDLQNNRFVNVDDVVNFVLLLKNVRVGSEDEANLLIKMLKENRLLPVEGENVDAKFLTNQLDQGALQHLANDIKQKIDEISRVPNLSGIDFSQNASEPIIKIKTKPLLDLCKEKELYFTEPLMRVLKLVLDFCKDYDRKDFSTYDFDMSLCEIDYSHELPSNDLDMITQIANLSNAKLINPDVALSKVSWIKNVSTYIKGMEKYNESVDKRAKEMQNKDTNDGINKNNVEKQKSKVVSKDQMDNQDNYAKGLSNKINENNE